MTLHALAIPTFTQMLRNLSGQLDKGAAFAADSGLAPSDLIDARLAPDMFPLSDQVRFTCHQATQAVARLTGQTPPDLAEAAPDFEGLKALIAATIAKLEATSASAFDGAAERAIELIMPNGIIFDMTGDQYLRDWALPQFYFHLVTAYDLLRHRGVALGKPDYVAHVFPYIRPGTMPGR
ncbi:DUF1993 domain-containing protein [Caulobacter soli]|uniref:DUF1993 domain-containing protein n=1 Tax=Caulobacter soli TaxID=2708539 RepID=UPI0013EBE5CB|nr:DUF1993 domain-containing protein [Caulobacter soli]